MDIVMVVTVSVVIIGIITCLLYIDTLNQLLSVKRFFPKTKNRSGFSDILNYAAAVENGIIICKDGSFIAAYEYFTQDNASTSDEEQEQFAAFFNRAIKDLGAGWIIYTDHIRQSTKAYSDRNSSDFPDDISFLIDEERRSYFESKYQV